MAAWSPAPTGDWGVLLRAVQARLRSVVRDAPGSPSAAPADDAARHVHAQVLECVHALDALHAAWAEETDRCRRLQSELTDATAALARSAAELTVTRNGERRAQQLALHDSLTGLPNRLFFGERLDRALTAGGCVHAAVVYLDLDGLKAINDRHGHDTGDELLKIVAARLRGALRTPDVVCRLGGDEFACLLTDRLSRLQLEHLACKLFDTVAAPMQIGELGLVVRASIGIATCPADGTTGAVLLKQADTAMYRAKREQTGYAFTGRVGTDAAIASAPSKARTSWVTPAVPRQQRPAPAAHA